MDLDAEEHDTKPFSAASSEILEYTDELTGRILVALPGGTVLALVSDHGFVPVDQTVHPPVNKVTPFWVTAPDAGAAGQLEALAKDPANGIGRRISLDEWKHFLPGSPLPAAVYEPADGFVFSPGPTEGRYGKPYEIGTHCLWPGRPGYRSVFLLWGPGIQPARRPEISILDILPKLTAILCKSGC